MLSKSPRAGQSQISALRFGGPKKTCSKSDCKDPNVEQEPESWTIINLCTKFRVALERLVASQAAKMDTDLEPPVLIEPDVLEEPGSEVVAELKHEPEIAGDDKPKPEPEPEIGEPFVETLTNLSAELAMELVPPTPVVRVPVTLKSPDLYDSLQIFLQETGSQEIWLFMVRSTVESILIREDCNAPIRRVRGCYCDVYTQVRNTLTYIR